MLLELLRYAAEQFVSLLAFSLAAISGGSLWLSRQCAATLTLHAHVGRGPGRSPPTARTSWHAEHDGFGVGVCRRRVRGVTPLERSCTLSARTRGTAAGQAP